MTHILRQALLLLSLLAPAAPQNPARTPVEGSSVEQKLDAAIPELVLESRPVPDVLKELSQQTGVPITLEDRAVNKLPWGAQTKFSSVTIRDSTLREALPRILQPLALQFKIEDNRVVISPSPALERLDGRITWKELELYNKLAGAAYSPETFKQFELQYRITSKLDAPALLADQLARAGTGNTADLLETATASLNWTWIPQDTRIVILTQQAMYARGMARRMTGRYDRRPLGEILFELGREAGVHVHLQAGTFTRLPRETVDRYSLFLTNASIRQAFDYIAAETGLAYSIEPDGVHVGPADNIEKMFPPRTAEAEDPYVAKFSIPYNDKGINLEFLLRESELPRDIRQKRDQFIKQLREASRAAASQPSPGRPATSPAAKAASQAASGR